MSSVDKCVFVCGRERDRQNKRGWGVLCSDPLPHISVPKGQCTATLTTKFPPAKRQA